MTRVPVRHIGLMRALCDRRKRADLRADLGVERYRQLGVRERLAGEPAYQVCTQCIALVGNLSFMLGRSSRYRQLILKGTSRPKSRP